MLKALRRKLVFISMFYILLIMTALMLAGLACVHVHFVQSYREILQRELMMERGRHHQSTFPPPYPVPGHLPSRSSYSSFMTEKTESGTWKLVTPWMHMEEDTLLMLCQRAQEATSPTGFWRDQGIAYSRQNGRIVFVNLQKEYARMKNTLQSWLLIYVGAIGMFFLMSYLLARRALKPVEAAWAQQQRFVSDASHELKTPLTVILANLDILENEQGTNRWLSAARAEGLTMKKLLEDLLFLARSDEVRNISVFDEAVNLSNLISETALAFEAPAYERHLTLSVDILPNQTMMGNADLLRHLLFILLDNAVKYTPEGGGIQVTLKKNRDKLQLKVHNSQAYIPQEDQERLFDRFYRLDHARNNEKGGHGLGLSIAAEIARQHGATLKVSSQQEKGTSFTFTVSDENNVKKKKDK